MEKDTHMKLFRMMPVMLVVLAALASDAAGWITGECLAVSGGLR